MATALPDLETPAGVAEVSFTNPVIGGTLGRDHGDPFVLRYLDEYFLYHTTDDGDAGISVHRSRDLVSWDFAGYALSTDAAGRWAQTDFWAPEVMYWRGSFYMYFAATVFAADGHGDPSRRRIGVARSDHPLGPFVAAADPLVAGEYAIDPHPFQDEDGSLWLFYNVRRDDLALDGLPSSANVVDRLITPTELAGKATPVSVPSADWEGSADGSGYVNEGSYVLKRRGRYHELYSGSHYRHGDYAIGLSSADALRGRWRKHAANPIFARGPRISGPGHQSVILAPDGVTSYAVYHGYDDGRPGRKVSLDRLRWCGDRPLIGSHPACGRPTESAQLLPPRAVHDPGVPWWHADLFVQADWLEVDTLEVALPLQTGPVRVRVNQGIQGLRVWLDGRLALVHAGHRRPHIGCYGEILAGTLTSHVDDERVHRMQPGEQRSWRWGGTGPLELSVAVDGSATVTAGSESTRVDGSSGYRLGHLLADNGAKEIVVEAGPTGAHVTDLAVTAR